MQAELDGWMDVIPDTHSGGPSYCMLLSRLPRTHATRAVYVAARFSRALHASSTPRDIDMEKVDTTARLAELRKLMRERKIDVYSTSATLATTVSCC